MDPNTPSLGSKEGVNSFFEKHLLGTLDEGTYFSLNQQTITSLDILPKLKPDGTPDLSGTACLSSRSDTTVYNVLNKCRTTSGQRLLAIWLKHPLKDRQKIETRLDIVQHITSNHKLRTICYDDYLRKVPDLLRISHKISIEKCNLMDLMKIYNCCRSMRQLCSEFLQLSKCADIDVPEAVLKLFKWVHIACQGLGDYMSLLEDNIIVDSVDETGEYMVKPGKDTDLANLSLELSSLSAQARRVLSDVADDLELEKDKSIKLETDADKGFGLRVTKQNEQIVRNSKQYEQLSLVKKDGYRFTNRALTRLSNKYISAKEEYDRQARIIIEDVVSKAVMYHDEVIEFSIAITFIDVFVALSVAAVQGDYIRPLVLDCEAEKIDIEKLRHPCIESQPDIENYVPNDIAFSGDGKKFYIITGPNMGGKSTFIKSVAVGVIMAQCGSLIAASEARISIVDGVFTRVGAGDRQVDGISTFMEEMIDMSGILKDATRHSLVIIDELGRGTSTFDGFGLAWSISHNLATEIKCYTLFATHFHELTEMSDEVDTVGNLHVKAVCQGNKLIMLYNIGEGVCDESYGINVAEFTNFPKHVVDNAKEKLKQFEEVAGFNSKKEVRDFVRDIVKNHYTQ